MVITAHKIPEWSRGHKARGQGHKKNPRPRTAFRRTDLSRPRKRMLEAKDQLRTQPQVLSKKKGLQKSFLGDLQFINVPRIFDWGRPKSQIPYNDVIKNFPNRFLWDKDIVGWKI